MDAGDVGEASSFGHSAHHFDFLPDAVAQHEFTIGVKHREREAWKSTSAALATLR